jgi:hypothetical protein
LVVAVALTYMMYQRYSSTGKLMPAGMVAGISGGMAGEQQHRGAWWQAGAQAGWLNRQQQHQQQNQGGTKCWCWCCLWLWVAGRQQRRGSWPWLWQGACGATDGLGCSMCDSTHQHCCLLGTGCHVQHQCSCTFIQPYCFLPASHWLCSDVTSSVAMRCGGV